MPTTKDKGPLTARMLAVMETVSFVQKGDKKVNNQYTYVSHDQVMAALRPALVANGIVTTASVVDYKQDGNRTEVVAEVTFINADDRDDTLTIRGLGFGCDGQDKGPGKAVSYAVKYALLKSFCLETGDDPDANQGPDADHKPAAAPKQQTAPAPASSESSGEKRQTISDKQRKLLYARMKAKDMGEEDMREIVQRVAGVEHSKDIHWKVFDELLEQVAAWSPGAAAPDEIPMSFDDIDDSDAPF
jgi:hypothetical protein